MQMEHLCTEEHAPKCKARCPLHVDMREICRLLRNGSDARARDTFASAAVLPRITAKLCDSPCMVACQRAEVDESVNIGALERYLTSLSEWERRSLSPRFKGNFRAAIVGSGASGLTAAAYLASKGCPVTVFERGNFAGANLVGKNDVTKADIDHDIAPFAHLVEWRFCTEVGSAPSLERLAAEYDAVLCTGDMPAAPIGSPDPDTLQIADRSVFFAGRKLLSVSSFVESLSSGKRAALTIDRFLKGVSLTAQREREGAYETELYTSIDGAQPLPSLSEQDGYNSLSAQSEASRCLDCHCMECVRECVFMQKFRRFPRLYIREIANTISLLRDGLRSGKNLMVACSMCGLCGKLCPNGLSMEAIARLGRAAMVEKDELSEAIYDFPVRDMLFSNGEEAALCRHAPHTNSSKRVFFPGCQLAASAPGTVLDTYAHLLSLESETGIFLGCCGAPADWSGRERLYEETMATLKAKLRALGDVEAVCACPTCLKQMRAAGIRAVSLYPLLDSGPLPDCVRHPQQIAVHDSCSARDEAQDQNAVRSLLTKCGYSIEALNMSGEKTKCCGYGGLVFYGDRDVAGQMIQARTNESPLPYISYCSVCRDYLTRAGKPGLHVLDIFFGKDSNPSWEKPGASISEKEWNRLNLADDILRRFYGEERPERQNSNLPLNISGPVRAVLEDRLITEHDLSTVITAAQSGGKRLVRPSDGHFIASLRPGFVTYWVEYAPDGDGFIVYNAYSHRVDISEAQT